jgi:two-component system phosphate regulon sensor histidine kinase PhoR
MARKKEWYENLIHDLKAPLTAVKLNIDAVQYMGPLNDAQLATIDKAIKRIDTMSDMIKHALDKLAQDAVYVEVKLDRVIAACLEMVEASAQERRITIQVDMPPSGIGTVMAEANELDKVLLNLLTNAIKYNVDGGHITLRAEGDKKSVRISISDTGRGIAPEDQVRVFDRWVTSGQGSGVGLSIVKATVERHGGQIALESQVGIGTTVTITLPRKQSSEKRARTLHEAESMDSTSGDDPVSLPRIRMPKGDRITTSEMVKPDETLDAVDDDSQESDDNDSADAKDDLLGT